MTISKHLRPNFWLLGLTIVLCTIVYPAALWIFSQTFYRWQAEGSLVDRHGRRVSDSREAAGSLLIAQPFDGPAYFHPRPSAVGYNAAASGGSNLAASNYQLRLRVAKSLGPIVKYGQRHPKAGQFVGPDIEQWFRTHPTIDGETILAYWAKTYPAAAVAWVKDNKANAGCVELWRATHANDVAKWIGQNPATPQPKPEDLAAAFFESFSREKPGTFPSLGEQPIISGATEPAIVAATAGSDIQANFFELWLAEHEDVDLERVPADLVTTSGSGLDPHITLKNALAQLDRVAADRAQATGREPAHVRAEIEELLRLRAKSPLGGLAGVPLINVMEINLALDDEMPWPQGVEATELSSAP